MEKVIYKISSKSNPNSVSGAIVSSLNENKKIDLQAIGAGALNQAIKAIAVARGFIAPMGREIYCIPAFISVEVEDNCIRTGIKLMIKEEK